MSLDTWHKDWMESNVDEYRLKEKLEILEKFLDRIEDVISAYDEEQYKDIIEDLKYEVENAKEGIDEV